MKKVHKCSLGSWHIDIWIGLICKYLWLVAESNQYVEASDFILTTLKCPFLSF